MPEGLSVADVGKELAEHDRVTQSRHDRILAIIEIALLSLVTVIVAWTGYSAAKWSTDSRVLIARSAALRAQSNDGVSESFQVATIDRQTFNAWYTAYVAGNRAAMRRAVQLMRLQYRKVFLAWRAKNPDGTARAGELGFAGDVAERQSRARQLGIAAAEKLEQGQKAGETSDKIVRLQVLLAGVLFLVGISTRFPMRAGRYALVVVSVVLLGISLMALATLPRPEF